MPQWLGVSQAIKPFSGFVVKTEPGDKIYRDQKPASKHYTDEENQSHRPRLHVQVVRNSRTYTEKFFPLLIQGQCSFAGFSMTHHAAPLPCPAIPVFHRPESIPES